MNILREGRVWKYGDDVNTDVIFPGCYVYELMSEKKMGTHALEGLGGAFNKEAKPGDIIIAGKNWGCGSSREQAVKCLKARGIGAIIAGSFSRIYYRNCINEGLPVVICPEAAEKIGDKSEVEIDFGQGVIRSGHLELHFPPYPEYVAQIVQRGGLVPFIRRQDRDSEGNETEGCNRTDVHPFENETADTKFSMA